jgi:hypothetical protein
MEQGIKNVILKKVIYEVCLKNVNFSILWATYIRFSIFCFVTLVHMSTTYVDIISLFRF